MTQEKDAIFEALDHYDLRSPLVSFIALSVVGHLAAFYSLQVVYPPPVSQFPADARLVFLSPNTSSQAMLAWVESNDFMNANARTEGPDQLDKLNLRYRPSYAVGQPHLLQAPALNVKRLPAAMSLGRKLPIPMMRPSEVSSKSSPSGGKVGILASIEGEDQDRLLVSDLFLGHIPIEEADIREARFGFVWQRKDVGPRVFVIDSTGNDQLDARIALALQKLRPSRERFRDVIATVRVRTVPLKEDVKVFALP